MADPNGTASKEALRSALYLDLQNPVDKAAHPQQQGGISRPPSAVPGAAAGSRRPLTAVPKRPASRAGDGHGTGTIPTATFHGTATAASTATLSGVPRPASSRPSGASSLIAKTRRLADGTAAPMGTGTGTLSGTARSNAAAAGAPVSPGRGVFEHSFMPRGVPPRLRPTEPLGRGGIDEASATHAASTAAPVRATSGNGAAAAAPAATAQSAADAAVAARVHTWYQLLQLFKKQPESIEFVYLKNAEPHSVVYNPYNLDVVPHSEVKGQDNYYTMSSKGVTHFFQGQADFSTLEQFERDYFLYCQLTKLRLFRQFRLWKSFKVWRRHVHSRKAATCREVLTKQLFILNPVFREALLKVRKACDELVHLRLHALAPGELYSLLDFVEQHRAQHAAAGKVLQDFSRAVVHMAQEACFKAIELMEQTLLASKEKSSASSKLATMAASSVRLAVVKAAHMADEAEFSYAINAARRSEKRRVHNFVRLLDYVVCNTLHTLLVASVSDMLSALTPRDLTPHEDHDAAAAASNGHNDHDHDGLDHHDLAVMEPGAGAAAPQWGGPVLQLQVLLEHGSDELVFSPDAQHFFDAMTDVQVMFVEQTKLIPRLLTCEKLQDYMERPLDGGDVDIEGFNEIIVGEDHRQLVEALGVKLHEAFEKAEELRTTFTGFRDLVVENRSVSADRMREEVARGLRDLELFRKDILRFQKQLADVKLIEPVQQLGVLQVHLEELVKAFQPSPERCLSEIRTLLPQLAADTYHDFITKIHQATSRMQSIPANVEEFAEYLEFYAHLEKTKNENDIEYDKVVAYYDLLSEFNIKIPEMQNAAYQTLDSDVTALRDAMWSADSSREALVQRFKSDLERQVEGLNKEVVDIRLLAQHDMILDDTSESDQVLGYTQELLSKVAAQQSQAQRINQYQRLFKLEETKFQDLDDCSEDVSLRHQLWASRVQWAELTEGWLASRLDEVEAAALEDTVTRYNKAVYKMERGLVPNKVVPHLRDSVNMWREFVPVVQNLRNPDMKDRHWVKVNEALGVFVERGERLTLQALLDLRVVDFKDALATISTEATQEAGLEALLDKVNDKWRSAEFTVNQYKEMKDTYVLGAVDEVMAVLEDSMVVIMTIMSSRFVAGIRAEVEKTEKMLRLFSDTLDEWLECQRQWLYLETIFSAADIQRQLPAEAKAFMQVDKQFKDVMRRTKDRPNALQMGTTPGLLEIFQKCNETLEVVQKNLEDYLETKRVSFPRFYFLSNDELLEILSQTRNAQAVQPHLQKCFDGIRLLDFGEDPKSIDIHAMLSGEGERVALGKNLKARGNVETWLTNVETNMRTSIRALGKKGVREYPISDRCQWIRTNPAQLVIVVSNIYWCQAVEACFESREPLPALRAFYTTNVHQLAALTGLVRGELSSLERKVVVALITIDVHNRDIVETLVAQGTSARTEFAWQMQLRYEYDQDTDTVVVRQVNARFEYGYEYLGAQPRLVVTPMTDRCYMTLTGALHLKLGGAPAGPAGTGKTETTKDLGKALGVQCVVFNCGENLDYKFMGKFFSGLAQCGAWACFDEFNRIDIEVLSVVAQQLLAIQNALKAGLERFLFEGREIRLVPTCGVFITMNPGYAGRTELPDNLKALFRPMAMMIPDYALVAEVMLFSEGFEDAKNLSRKMVNLYKLASEQLSQQDHYDFGMRALKSVLVMAGALKRSNPNLNEDIVLIRAMRDSNVPKFLVEDARLFDAIVSDLFPGVTVPPQNYGELQVAIVDVCKNAGLQPVQPFVTKVIQLYETFNVRFGVMLVGPTGGGKTRCYCMLQSAMTQLRQQRHPDTNFQVVHTYALNPKAVKMGELYGEYNLLTSEWHDGLASNLIRAAVSDSSEDRKWVVFDGPVDAVWVENMNTVLDDNCMLCLPNGERIKLNPTTMRMLFEVQDLAMASPATVSRCGMVYVPPEDIGWRPFVLSWLAKLGDAHSTEEKPCVIGSATKEYIFGLFDKFIDPLLQHKRKHCRELIPSVDINNIASTASLFQALAHPSKGVWLGVPELDDSTKVALNYIFAFSATWGIGGNLDAHCWDKWDPFVRELMEGTANFPGGSGTVFDYRLDQSRNFMFAPWDELVPKFRYNPDVPYFQILVHTTDTVRYAFLLETCLEVHRSALFTGMSGVGKSAVVLDTITRLAPTKAYMPVVLNFSAQTSSQATQAMFEAKLEKKRKKRFGAPAGKHIVLFVDDVNMPAREVYGAQPPIELLRQFQDFGGFYDRKKLFWKEIEDTTLVAACGPPGGGRQEVTPRFMRHFTMLCMPQPSDVAMRTIFSSILSGFLDVFFTAEVRARMLRPMVDSSVDVYMRISQELLPTPAKSHYTFNLRDVSKVFQGILNIRPGQCPDPRATLTRLWVHENCRVFHDRLISGEDKEYFCQMLHELLKAKFEVREDYEDWFVNRTIMFGDYMRMGAPREDRVYEEVPTEGGKLQTLLENYMDEYNMSHTSQLSLVFFADAVQHISRIARILRQPRGNAMLVGVGGSGKQSLTRFAAFMSETSCVSIELTRNYGLPEFREDLKKLYRTTGIEGKPVAFLFTDNHIVSEAFVEDINNLLNSGEITDLFALDERERVFAEIRSWVIEHGIEETRDAMWRAFINRVRDNLHLVLAMSPVGEAFRARCRQFPSLINCCTIDWFSEWPEEALLSVSSRFLSNQELGGDAVNAAVARMCVDIHTGVAGAAERFYQELRRRYYVTPKSYLDLIQLYTRLLAEKRQDMALARDRLLNGLAKLQETNHVVDKMKTELNDLQPILAAKTVDTQNLLVQVEAERKDAEAIRRNVQIEEQEVKVKQVETQALKDDAQKDLEEVLPALEAAEKALAALNKNDIIEIKTFTKPPPLVQLTMEGVCILLQERPDWDTAKRVLGESNFIKRLVDYDRDNMPDKVVRNIKRIIEDPSFTPDQVAKQSKAAMSMCLWVRAMDTYAKVSKIVEPKRNKLRTAQNALDDMNAKLEAKQSQLKDIEDKVERLQMQLENTQAELASLQYQADLSAARLGRAEKLISALGDESVRWKATAEDLGERMLLLVGDVFLSAACISYTGAFTGPYRHSLVTSWLSRCKELGIPVSKSFSLQSTVATAVEIREWNIQGLPTDALSIDNGILVTRGSRWPLMVDPQDQANRWVKAMESKNGLRSLKVSDANILRTLENCIRIGSPVLLEDVGEALDPALEPLLQKRTFTQGTRVLIRLGDSDVDYDPNFKFYMTTKLPNPHYLPEVCIKVNLINFTVTIKGLEDQLLGDVVRKECPELEEAKDRLVVSISNDKRQLQELEDKVLKLLRESTGNILDDEVLINTLNNSKQTSGIINTRVREAEETERQINEKREVYRPVPVRGSILYFVVADLALIDPMYQYSLAYFTKLFNYCIDAAAPSDELPQRLQNLLDFTTEFMYKMVCRGLFEAHKMIFSFLICTAIQRAADSINPAAWNFFLRGAAQPPRAPKPLPATSSAWLGEDVWLELQALETAVPELRGLSAGLQVQPDIWRSFTCSSEPDAMPINVLEAVALSTGLPLMLDSGIPRPADEDLPPTTPSTSGKPGSVSSRADRAGGASNAGARGVSATPSATSSSGAGGGASAFTRFHLLLLVKVLCEDQLVGAVQRYVAACLGQQFTESPSSSLQDIYHDSTPATPIIFILSQGADPTSSLARFGESMGRPVGSRLQIISLGQGQGPIAESTLNMAVKSGDWVCLQNCHLAKSWMPRLERIVEDLQARFAKQQQFQHVYGSQPALQKTDSIQGTTAGGAAPAEGDAASPTSPDGRASPSQPQYDVHPEFRLWLTSMPAPHFPVPVLQNGIKITQEPPKGVRANLLRTYADLPDAFLDLGVGHVHGATWKKLVFACAFFHAVIQERRKFGPLGWNIRYEFSAGDLECALSTLRMFLLEEGRELPWEALVYVTGQINYGGRVTDDNDRRLLMNIMEHYYCPAALKDGHVFTPKSGTYRMPPLGDVASYSAAIRALPLVDEPAVFGLHANASIAFNVQESRKLIDTVLSIQPRVAASAAASTGSAKSSEEVMLELASGIQASLPAPLDVSKASVVRSPFAALPSGHDNSLGTVLSQELDRFNHLLTTLVRSLVELQRAVKGLAVMSAELEAMGTALTNNQVPSLWQRAAYPSLKPLASWVKDFSARMEFMSSWLYDGEPPCFWLPGFFFPQGFLTAVLQNHARKTNIAIDRLSFSFAVTPHDGQGDISKPPASGVYCHGMFLESAAWDKASGALAEAQPRVMLTHLPIIHFVPAENHAPPATDYQCPLYKTRVRAGVLSTTGQSTNFVLNLSLPMPAGTDSAFWVLQGVAALMGGD